MCRVYDAVVLGGWKYIHYLRAGEIEELYDLRNDPEEFKNLAEAPEQKERITVLRATLTGRSCIGRRHHMRIRWG